MRPVYFARLASYLSRAKKKMSNRLYRRDAAWAVWSQLFVLFSFFPLVWMIWNEKEAGSFVLGGLICLLPNIYLYVRVFSYFGARAAKQIVNAFYRGEIVKAALTAAGFIAALSMGWVLPLWLFVGYIVTQGGFWVGPVLLGYLRMRNSCMMSRIAR